MSESTQTGGSVTINDAQHVTINHWGKEELEKSADTGDSFDDEFEDDDIAEVEANCYNKFLKIDDEPGDPGYTFVLGPVLVPDRIDKQGDLIEASEIEKAAHGYMEDSQRGGFMHSEMLSKRSVQLVESYIKRTKPRNTSNPIDQLPEGTWLIAYRVYDEELRKMIRAGRLTGFSIGGRGMRLPSVSEEE